MIGLARGILYFWRLFVIVEVSGFLLGGLIEGWN